MWLGFTVEFWVTVAIAIVGIVVTVYLSRQRNRGSLSLGITRSANLMSEIVRYIPNLKVLYENEEIQDELVWVAGVLINTGVQDIGRSIVSQFPILRLGKDAAWQEFSVTPAKGIDPERRVLNATDAQISWSLLKPFESITFSALIRTKDRTLEARLRQGSCISIETRIENADSIFTPNIADYATTRSLRRSMWNIVLPLAMATAILVSEIFFPSKEAVTAVRVAKHSELYVIAGQHDGVLHLTTLDGLHSIEVPVQNISTSSLTQIERVKRREWWEILVSSVYCFAMLAFATLSFVAFRGNFRSYRYLNPKSSIWDILFFWRKDVNDSVEQVHTEK